LCTATFYGEGTIHLPLNESITRLHLHLDFLTGRPGPLFSAVGSVDFLYVEVTSSGRVLTSVDLGAGRVTLVSPPGISSVADRRWHSISVVLDRSYIQLILDDVFESRTMLPGDFVQLNIDVGVRLGMRFTEVRTLPPQRSSTTSFRGCLRSVSFNTVDVLASVRRAQLHTASQSSVVTWNRLVPMMCCFQKW